MKRVVIILLIGISGLVLVTHWKSADTLKSQREELTTAEDSDIKTDPIEKPEEGDSIAREADQDNEPFRETELIMDELRREGRYLFGKVVNLYGQPVPRARVTARSSNGIPPFFAVTRDDGEFYIKAPPGSPYSLEIESAGLPILRVEVPAR